MYSGWCRRKESMKKNKKFNGAETTIDEDEATKREEEEAAKVAASLGRGDKDILSLTIKVAKQGGQALNRDEVRRGRQT